jgi:hypothetical protein
VSLRLSGRWLVDDALVGPGVASPTAEMMRARQDAYDAQEHRDAIPTLFVVDVPLTADGHIGLVFPDGQGGWQVRRAGAAELTDLITRHGGYAPSQGIQFLAVPQTDEQYQEFHRDALEVAARLGREVYIVGEPGATVEYADEVEAFEAWPANWSMVAPPHLRPARYAGELLPPYFSTRPTGALMNSSPAGSSIRTFSSLVTFEPGTVIRDVLDEYEGYQEAGGGLPIVLVPTRDGRPRDASGEAVLSAERVAETLADLAGRSLDAERELVAGAAAG